jgi:hypothetical protein
MPQGKRGAELRGGLDFRQKGFGFVLFCFVLFFKPCLAYASQPARHAYRLSLPSGISGRPCAKKKGAFRDCKWALLA